MYWKLGQRIAEDYMIPYNQKMFNKELEELGTYWLEKLPNVSFEETLLSCLDKKPYGTQPGHAQFYYPKKHGYGEVWKRMADALGNHIRLDSIVTSINYDTKQVKTNDGNTYKADYIITTIPWQSVYEHLGMPDDIKDNIRQLKFSSVETRYFDTNMDTKAHWIYYPDPNLAYHRVLVRSNFCPESKGYWTETNSQRLDHIPKAARDNYYYMNQYAYPLNTVGKPAIMDKLLSWCKTKNIYGLGRWGEWQHYNSDVTVEKALQLAGTLASDTTAEREEWGK